jgi:hypothetical protein
MDGFFRWYVAFSITGDDEEFCNMVRACDEWRYCSYGCVLHPGQFNDAATSLRDFVSLAFNLFNKILFS